MIIYPAIDLIAGEVVRLHKGDFEQKTTYGTDPVSVRAPMPRLGPPGFILSISTGPRTRRTARQA
ncbi:MAG: hypothetical protein CM15mP115_25200 [Alphaproteobacteria bacterium]|nr:MAG: hypothetical protein CM15mP115_25200 [Alphaproteobacteria bacterium]